MPPRLLPKLLATLTAVMLAGSCLSAGTGTPASDSETPLAAESRLRAKLATASPDDPAFDADRVELAEALVDFLLPAGYATEVITLLNPLRDRYLAADSPPSTLGGRLALTLAKANFAQGELATAQADYTQAVNVLTAAIGPDHPDTLLARLAEAIFASRTGHPDVAFASTEEIVRRFREVAPNTRGALQAAGQYSVFLIRLGRKAEAEVQIRENIAAHEANQLFTSTEYAVQLNNLAYLLNISGRNAECAEIMERIVAERSTANGPEAGVTLTSRYNLAFVYIDLGRYDEAETLLRHDLAVIQARADPGRLDPADYLGRLGDINLKRGHIAAAVADLAAGQILYDRPREGGWRDQEDRTRERLRASLALAYHLNQQPTEAQANLEVHIDHTEDRFRQRLSFTSEADRVAFHARERPLDLAATLGYVEPLARVALRFKGLVLDSLLEDQRNAANSADPEVQALLTAYQAALTDLPADQAAPDALLGSELDRLERELARRTIDPALPRRALATDPAAVLRALPADTALVEYMRYLDMTPQATGKSPECYLAVIGSRDTGWQMVRLGEAARIDGLVARLQLLARRGGDFAWAQELRQAIFDPIQAVLDASTTRLLISPDAALHRVAFGFLPTDAGTFIGERLAIARVGSGRDLLVSPRQQANPAPHSTILAAPIFGGDLVDLAPLPGAATEARRIAPFVPTPTIYLGSDAVAAPLRLNPPPTILHLATHAIVPPGQDLDLATRLRQTGLALAAPDDLFSTAQIAALDLRGTELTFLSACDSGGGEAVAGEGVLGLTRSFRRAGVKTVVFTLWPVSDEAGANLIPQFYAALQAGRAPAEALVEAQRHALVAGRQAGISPLRLLQDLGAYSVSIQ